MMWIVEQALQHPYSFVALALLILVLGGASIHLMRTDIFPEIDVGNRLVVESTNDLKSGRQVNVKTLNDFRQISDR